MRKIRNEAEKMKLLSSMRLMTFWVSRLLREKVKASKS